MNEWVELGQNKDGTHNICCGVCGVGKFKSRGHARSYYTRHKFKYCPNCGARTADHKTEPQYDIDKGTIKCDNCSENGSYKCSKCDGEMYFKRIEIEDEPQTDCSWK